MKLTSRCCIVFALSLFSTLAFADGFDISGSIPGTKVRWPDQPIRSVVREENKSKAAMSCFASALTLPTLHDVNRLVEKANEDLSILPKEYFDTPFWVMDVDLSRGLLGEKKENYVQLHLNPDTQKVEVKRGHPEEWDESDSWVNRVCVEYHIF